jgi:DNA/RNA endonuclease G (NUC1)
MNYLPPHTNVKIQSSIDNLNHYKKIFTNKHKKDNNKDTILLLKKKEFDILYSCKNKYPLIVSETITNLTGKTDPNVPQIDRRVIDDPFREDMEIPEKYRHTIKDYETYMEYGGSMGHNAPAGQHKTNLEVYYDTFLLSNITPQEIVFNSSLWVLFENWCKLLGRHQRLQNIKVFTGSIPEENTSNINGVKMNVPVKMFKIVCFEMIGNPGITFMEIIIANNQAYYINPKIQKFNINPFLIPTKSYNWFQNISGININYLLEYYGYNNRNIKPFRTNISMEIVLHMSLQKLMKKSFWFGNLIYATSLDDLEYKWKECKKFEKEFETMFFHQQFYDLAKKRFLRDGDNIKKLVSFNESTKLFNKLNKLNKANNANKAHKAHKLNNTNVTLSHSKHTKSRHTKSRHTKSSKINKKTKITSRKH